MASGDEAERNSVQSDERDSRRSRSRDGRSRSRSRSKGRDRSPSKSRSGSRHSRRSRSKQKQHTGKVIRWHERGFGFIKPDDDGDDIFCHVTSITDGNALAEGSTVTYDLVYDDKRKKYRTQNLSGGIREDRPPPRRRDYDDRRRGYSRKSRSRSRGGYGDRYYDDRDRKRGRYDYDSRERGRRY